MDKSAPIRHAPLERVRGNRGFSLAELLVVLALGSLLLAGSIPAITRMPRDTLSARASRQLSSDIAVARARAISRRTPVTVTVNPASASYIVTPPGQLRRLPPGTVLTLGAGAQTDFTFDARGLLTVPANVSFVMTAAGKTNQIVVTAGGAVRVN